jgi:hypothetical protein
MGRIEGFVAYPMQWQVTEGGAQVFFHRERTTGFTDRTLLQS